MIANFFQNLNATRVEYLLISGQATVLYGAATFSEVRDWMEVRARELQLADRRYWRAIVAELGKFRKEGVMIPEGTPV